MMRTCTACKIEKPVAEFSARKASKDGLQHRCKPCLNASVRETRRRRPDLESARNKRWRQKSGYKTPYDRNGHLRRKYGITQDDYDRMYQDQKGACAICATEVPVMDVDHNHTTGEVRELLCGPCNRGLGDFNEDPDRLMQAAAYLQRHRKVRSPSYVARYGGQ